MTRLNTLRNTTTCAIILALLVVMLGAYTRLTNAGLGCPDWPGCYGQLVLPHAKSDLIHAQQIYPNTPLQTNKAWTEMLHRYAAGSLALLVTLLAGLSFRYRSEWTPWLLVLLILFQAALGMWTVTLKLLPIVVSSHLLGGILILTTLCYFRWQISSSTPIYHPSWRRWVALGVVLLFCQTLLGGWVSSNYAGIACIGFPRCNGIWLPKLDLPHAFQFFSSLDANYQGGLLDNHLRITIQFMHRVGALISTTYILMLSVFMMYTVQTRVVRVLALATVLLILIQVSLGIINVLYILPLWIAVAHNGVAAVLLSTIISLYYTISTGETDARSLA